MITVGVHGWAEQDGGKQTVGRLTPFIDDISPYTLFKHQWPRSRTWALLAQRSRTRQEAELLASRIQHGAVLVTYSNGAALAKQAIEDAGVEIPLWIIIAGALPRDFDVPDGVKKVIVMHSDGDTAVRLGRLWTWVNPVAWVKGHDWGDLGAVGYRGGDARVVNWPARSDKPHGGWFDAEPLSYWGPMIRRQVEKAV